MTLRSPRTGFTLLEVIVTLSIGVLLLSALYVALNVQLHQMRSGREVVELNALNRSVLSRMSNDIATNLAPVDPRVVNLQALAEAVAGTTTVDSQSTDSSGTDSSSSNTSGTNTSNTSGTGSGSQSSNTQSSQSAQTTTNSTSSSSETAASTTGTPAYFNAGIQGDAATLHLYISQGPKNAEKMEAGVSDLRRVTYYLAGGPEIPLGLARYEAKLATSNDGLTTQLPEDPTPFIVCKQVTNVMFEYYDGFSWQPSWDGRALMGDGKTPIGPPLAVAITLTIAGPETRPGVRRQSTLRHVVSLPSANGVDPAIGGVMP